MIELTDSQKEMMKAIKEIGKWATAFEIFLALRKKSQKSVVNKSSYDLKELVRVGAVSCGENVDTGIFLYKARL